MPARTSGIGKILNNLYGAVCKAIIQEGSPQLTKPDFNQVLFTQFAYRE